MVSAQLERLLSSKGALTLLIIPLVVYFSHADEDREGFELLMKSVVLKIR
jgi:hypothetical protein